MTEIEKLVLQVESRGATATEREVDKLDKTTKAAALSFGALKASSLAFYAAAAAVAAIVWKVGSAFVSATKTYQDFNAQLETATGSSENAAKAYQALQRFAAKTPYDLGQALKGFIQLTNSGLIPSERALYSFAATASGTGNSLEDMVEAVSKAAVGEFEPLRKFYIQAQQTNDKVIFSFQGVSTAVKKNARDIEQYFVTLGESKFPDAISKRMATLGGTISNIGDSWNTLLVDISRQGADSIITRAFKAVGDAIDELDAQIVSGQLQATIMAYWHSWKWVFDNIATSFNWLTGLLKSATKGWTSIFGDTDVDLKDLFSYKFPTYVHAALDLVAGYLVSWKDSAVNVWDAFYNKVVAVWTLIKSVAAATFAFIGNSLQTGLLATVDIVAASIGAVLRAKVTGDTKPFDDLKIQIASIGAAWGTVEKMHGDNLKTSVKAAVDAYTEIGKKAEETAATEKAAQELTVDAVMSGIDSNLAADASLTDKAVANAGKRKAARIDEMPGNPLFDVGEQIQADNNLTKQELDNAAKIRAAYEANKAAKSGQGGDELAGFAKTVPYSASAAELAAQEAVKKQLFGQDLKDLEGSLLTQNMAIGRGYEAQKETILASTELTQDQKKDLILKALQSSLTTEQGALEQAYDARKNFILSDTQLTEQTKSDLILKLTAAREEQVRQLELKTQKVRLDQASDFFGNIASIGSTFGEKGFKIAKAAAIAQSTIKTYEAATAAYAALAGIPYIGPALGIAAAGAAIVAGAANIAQIKAQQYTPAYAMGGMIPAGAYGLVGEAGPEIVRTPGAVTNNAYNSSNAATNSVGNAYSNTSNFNSNTATNKVANDSYQTVTNVANNLYGATNNRISNSAATNIVNKPSTVNNGAISNITNNSANTATSRAIYASTVNNATSGKVQIVTMPTYVKGPAVVTSAATSKAMLAGHYAMGGMVPAGKYGLVGEQGPEIVKGPAVVTSAANTRNRPQQPGNVIIHNHGAPVDAQTQRDNNGDLLVILKPLLDENRRKTKHEITQDIHKGGSPLTGALETKYALARKGV